MRFRKRLLSFEMWPGLARAESHASLQSALGGSPFDHADPVRGSMQDAGFSPLGKANGVYLPYHQK